MDKKKIFLIEADNDARPIYRRELKKLGYQISLAIDEEDALERVGQGNLQVDLILIDIPGKTPAEALVIAKNIAEKGKLDVLIIAIAADFEAELEGTDEQISESEYIVYLGDPQQLLNLLSRLK